MKEGYDDADALRFVTAMQKIDAYAPDAGNWFWASWNPAGELAVAGAADQCIGCHAAGQDCLLSSTW